jgi:DNA-binding NarL/FixJ family response regulator
MAGASGEGRQSRMRAAEASHRLMTPADPTTRVFLVEDSAILTKLLVGLIEAEPGTRVVGRDDTAAGAIGSILREKPHAVILDLHLREGSGYDVLRALRGAQPPPVIIVLTNHVGASWRQVALDGGAHHFFDKSTQIPLMLSVIRSLARADRPPP